MFSRTRRSAFLLFTAFILSGIALCGADTEDVARQESATLYRRANDYVSRISEKDYSYAYLQFYWKRAQANIDRIARVYPETETGRLLRADVAKIGPYELSYFKERVLPRLEEKRIAAFDAVNCAIFLYNLEPDRWDASRYAALESILEVLARQKRWSGALSFPVLDKDRPLLLSTIFRVAARFEQQKIISQLLADIPAEEQASLWPIVGEALALNGRDRDDIAKLIEAHPEDAVKLAVLNAMIDREISMQLAATLKIPLKNGIQKVHYSLMKLDVRDDVEAVAKTLFPSGSKDAELALSRFHAGLGQKPAVNAPVEAHTNYLEFLAASGRSDELIHYLSSTRLTGEARTIAELKGIELLAEIARSEDSAKARAQLVSEDPALADAAAVADFQGRMNSIDAPLTVRENTFADLGVKDPCVLARALMDWSLTPNRAIRGAAPWNAVVRKYLPGFENLPVPKSKAVQDASGASKPY